MDQRAKDLPQPEHLILVAIMPRLQDMEIARVFGWYRIPLRVAPKVIAVDYLAFYQPGAFGVARKWRVEYLAPVLGHELTTRAALLNQELDHPRAHEEYFKIQLGPLISLPNPILADGWRRFTFLYTTGAYLRIAKTLKDLVIRTEERKLLWYSLRERALSMQNYRPETLTAEDDLTPEILTELLGMLTDPAGAENL